MDKALEESEKKRELTEMKKEREIQEWKVKFEKLAAAEDKGRSLLDNQNSFLTQGELRNGGLQR